MKKQWPAVIFLLANVILNFIMKFYYNIFGLLLYNGVCRNTIKITRFLIALSVAYICFLLRYKLDEYNEKKFIFAGIILLLISTATIIWLPFNKESFTPNYTTILGETMVDLYGTYKPCLVYTVISVLYSIIGLTYSIVCAVRLKKNKCEKYNHTHRKDLLCKEEFTQ